MSFLQAKIEPYCSFTIDLGPQYVERVFDSLLTRQGVKDVVQMNIVERLEIYLQHLHQQIRSQNRKRYTFTQFYLAHFCQQLSTQTKWWESSRHLQEKALFHYETYLELVGDTAESRFYAQWQMAILQYKLNYPWLQTEVSLMKAATFDPIRGEPLKQLVDHYCRTKAWNKAYHLSSLAIKKYLDKNPVAVRRWFIDFKAYDWHLIQNHVHICYQNSYIQEARQMYQQLRDYSAWYSNQPTLILSSISD